MPPSKNTLNLTESESDEVQRLVDVVSQAPAKRSANNPLNLTESENDEDVPHVPVPAKTAQSIAAALVRGYNSNKCMSKTNVDRRAAYAARILYEKAKSTGDDELLAATLATKVGQKMMPLCAVASCKHKEAPAKYWRTTHARGSSHAH